ncbi:MAG: hypothetical protein NC206_00795 [Bacteroides sp.]|nr:hypothetical protein [Roseburia sp.]MCM1345612.1 hypothetical protein [Bacteroides sp.]MCM1420753.1 hypothetical protein [Bacteroides sp.]
MDSLKTVNIIWAVSLIVIGLSTVLLSVFNVLEFDGSRAFAIAAGVTDMIALPALVFTTVRKLQVRHQKR